ncbi:hypothetical protein [Devosia sp.]|uniref:hypothetical protein n=1 Tax=Devosia sp. TaxID=1871048 RepID=UPI00326448FE
MTFTKVLAALGLVLSLATPAFAQDPSPVGNWQTTTGESRYAVSLCGDGTQLCAKLTWLRADARTPANLSQLNRLVVQGARVSSPNKWRGTVNYGGQKVSGSVTLVSSGKMRLTGCQLIACKSVDFVKM